MEGTVKNKNMDKQETQCENCKHFNKVTGSYYFGRCQKILIMVYITNDHQDTDGTYLLVRNEFCCNQYQEKK